MFYRTAFPQVCPRHAGADQKMHTQHSSERRHHLIPLSSLQMLSLCPVLSPFFPFFFIVLFCVLVKFPYLNEFNLSFYLFLLLDWFSVNPFGNTSDQCGRLI
ncbi:hypothetical protein BDV23DRAFT_160813 [Aspergillus alliaceus]|uniref:Uncharacterized protein n=1 Tax=Petromyces alliaceus TaxID=209559 RepID=A0A5N7C0B1_PETAA|nr:hypothetical protein BDV23DRAFT_160813 [Aspergillus alliaceus]